MGCAGYGPGQKKGRRFRAKLRTREFHGCGEGLRGRPGRRREQAGGRQEGVKHCYGRRRIKTKKAPPEAWEGAAGVGLGRMLGRNRM